MRGIFNHIAPPLKYTWGPTGLFSLCRHWRVTHCAHFLSCSGLRKHRAGSQLLRRVKQGSCPWAISHCILISYPPSFFALNTSIIYNKSFSFLEHLIRARQFTHTAHLIFFVSHEVGTLPSKDEASKFKSLVPGNTASRWRARTNSALHPRSMRCLAGLKRRWAGPPQEYPRAN